MKDARCIEPDCMRKLRPKYGRRCPRCYNRYSGHTNPEAPLRNTLEETATRNWWQANDPGPPPGG